MKTLDLIQGSPEWHAHRATHFNASDAPAMMGVSSYQTRTDLLDRMSTGISPDVDAATQRRFDDGHRSEALARPLAEEIIGAELYPVTGVNGANSASFDGLTMMEDVHFEHKRLNDRIRAAATAADLPLEYLVQVEHQFMVCETSKKCLFMATRWEGETCVERREFWIEPNLELRAKIVSGWAQLENDLATHKVHVEAAPVIGKTIESLPVLHVELTGMVTASNLAEFTEHAIAVFQGISTDLVTDEDFATAEKTVKWCADVESKLEATKQQALSQTRSIEDLFQAIDSIKEEARQKRLALDKLVKSRKESIKVEIVQEAQSKLEAHVSSLSARVGYPMQAIKGPFGEAIKGLKTVKSMRDAVETALANAKISASELADVIETNLKAAEESMHLFPDFAQHCTTAPALFSALIDQRKAQHLARVEAEAKAKIEANAQAEAAKPAAVTEKPQAHGNVIPAEFSGKTPADAVIDAEDVIAAFLNSREWAKGEANKARAHIVEFKKFESQYAKAA